MPISLLVLYNRILAIGPVLCKINSTGPTFGPVRTDFDLCGCARSEKRCRKIQLRRIKNFHFFAMLFKIFESYISYASSASAKIFTTPTSIFLQLFRIRKVGHDATARRNNTHRCTLPLRNMLISLRDLSDGQKKTDTQDGYHS